jgi:uncharacterized protein YxjI
MIAMPICELCDRFTIAKLKFERLPQEEADKEGLKRQMQYYEKGIDYSIAGIKELIQQLYEINGSIWDAEAEIRKGHDDKLELSEIGRRALVIRDLNRVRVSIKNKIATVTNQEDFLDCKMNHASQ